MKAEAQDTLFYDGLCPLCTREIASLRKLNRGSLNFQDIHQVVDISDIPSTQRLLKALHLKTTEGEWLVGVDATARAWSHTPWGWLFKPLRWPLIKPLVDRIYISWADKRYRKLYQCSPCMGAEE